MNTKSNRVLLGIILLIIACFVAFHKYFSFGIGIEFNTIVGLLGGLSFLLLYHTRRKSWALVIGLILTFLSAGKLFAGIPYIGNQIILSVIFLVPSFIFLIMFAHKGYRNYLNFGCMLFWLGVFILIRNIPFIRELGFSAFLFVIALGLITTYLISGRYFPKRKRTLYLSIIVFVLALLNIGGHFWFLPIIPSLGVIVLVGAGIILIVKGLKK